MRINRNLITKVFSTLLAIAVAVGFTGCAHKKSGKGAVDKSMLSGKNLLSKSELEKDFEIGGDSDSDRAGSLKTVNFPYDSSRITGEARQRLLRNAEYLKYHKNATIEIQGHCDERGSREYNLALGERRAKALKRFLVSRGVKSKRITTISYGKEKPVQQGHNEEAWSENRRGNFVILSNK